MAPAGSTPPVTTMLIHEQHARTAARNRAFLAAVIELEHTLQLLLGDYRHVDPESQEILRCLPTIRIDSSSACS